MKNFKVPTLEEHLTESAELQARLHYHKRGSKGLLDMIEYKHPIITHDQFKEAQLIWLGVKQYFHRMTVGEDGNTYYIFVTGGVIVHWRFIDGKPVCLNRVRLPR